jgi:enoyl-CoA hydratase/carnithine racemase
VRAVLITGQPGIFTSGNDIEDFMSRPPGQGSDGMESPVFLFMRALLECDKPVVAAVTGAAIGIGTTMLLHCDFVYVSDEARLAMPFVALGLVPEFASSLVVPQLMGHRRAAEKLLLGDPFTPSRRWNAASPTRCCRPARWSTMHAAWPSASTAAARGGARSQAADARPAARAPVNVIRNEGEIFGRRLRSPEAMEAFQAFFQKRKPDFSQVLMSLTVKLALSPLLVAQALLTRTRMPRLPEAAGARAGEVGEGGRCAPAGGRRLVGRRRRRGHQREALAAPLAARWPRRCGARVQWQLVAASGLTTAQTLHLMQREPQGTVDVAVIVTGVNDVVDQIPSHRAVSARDALANWLRNARGVQHVVFAPLPPDAPFPGLPQPLRWVAGSDARRHNDALARWAATRSDVSVVPLRLPLDAGVMATDGFHPGAPVYSACASGIATHLATHVWPSLRLEAARALPGAPRRDARMPPCAATRP